MKLKKMLSYAWPARDSRDPHNLPVVCYHSINPSWNSDARPVHPSSFRRHLDVVCSEFNPVSLSQFIDALLKGARLPERPILVTFDDGFVDNYELAFPILSEYKVPAVFFLATGFIDGKIRLLPEESWRAMSWDQVIEIDRSPLFSFGAHTVTHRRLGNLSTVEAEREILESKLVLQDRLGSITEAFAYPNGQIEDMPMSAQTAVVSSGFSVAFSTLWSTQNAPEHAMAIRRVMIDHDDTEKEFLAKVRGHYDFLLHWHQRRARFQLLSPHA